MKFEVILEKKQDIAIEYKRRLEEMSHLILPPQNDWSHNVFWMYSILLKEGGHERRDALVKTLNESGIESRPFFSPIHHMPPYHT
ncbi:MAG: DegT/DnrJ/EryC1/StrS family aminotransferase, partial [Bacteroidetes bacterium]|nr:DegT/DnrJ/EryC1/StrS family aminotransferase [Bacteroidota bacterium]